MSQSVFGAAAAVTMLNRALNNSSPAAAVFGNQVATAGSTEATQFAFARQFAASFDSLTDAQFAARVMGNMGMLPNDALQDAFVAYLGANAKADRGVIVLQLGQILSTMENATGDLAIYAPQAVAWNKEVEQSFIYSSNSANTSPYNGDFAPTPVDQGQTFTLTNVVDNFTGTGGNDTFTGGSAQIQAADTINGGGGTDTAKLYLDAGNAGLNAAAVEIFQIQSSVGGGATFNATNVAGAEQIWSAGSTTDLTVTGLKNNVTLGLDKTQSNLLANFVAGTIGAAETLKLATDSSGTAAGRVAVTVDDGGAASKFTTLDVNAVAGKSFIGITNHATAANATTDFATLKTSGAGTVNLAATTTAFDNLTTLELNAAGGSTVNLGGNAKAVKVTGSDANETVIFAAAQFNTQDVIDLGAGTNTLVLGDANLAQGAATELSKAINATKGVTTLGTTAVADVAILAARYSAIDSFAVGLGGAVNGTVGAGNNAGNAGAGTAAVSVSGVAASGDSLNVQNNLTGGAGGNSTGGNGNGGAGAAGLLVRMALDGGADSFSLSVSESNAVITGGVGGAENGAGTAGLAAAGIDAREVETLNIAVSKNLTVVGAAANGNSAAATADVLVGGNATLNITGAGNVNLGRVQANSADTAFQNLNIKAGDLAGSLTIVTGAGNDVIIVGSKGSDVTAGAGQDTITLGAGVDTVRFGAGDSGVLNGGVIGRIDVISGFTAGLGGDVIDEVNGVRGFTQLTSANQTTLTNAASLTDAILAAGDFAAANTWTAFSYGDKTYAVYTVDSNATFDNGDIVVELAGVTATALVAANFS